MLDVPLVGREPEMSRVAAAFERAAGGDPVGILLSGEAGVGKSRLLREITSSLAGEPWRVLDGYALPGQGVPPYFAMARVFRRLSRLSRLPSLTQFAAEQFATAPAHATPLDATGGQLRLLEAMAAHLEESALEQPTLVVLDDMQWAGQGDWAAAAHVLRSARGPLMFVLAARDGGLWDASSPALESLLELNRQRLLVDVRLGQLPRQSVDALCRAKLGGSVSESLLDSVIARTDGNPFLVEELLAQYVRGGVIRASGGGFDFASDAAAAVELPATVQQGTGHLVESLGTEAREVIELAAVAGRQFSSELLGRCGFHEGRTANALRAALTAGLVREDAERAWLFRHDLIREAVIAGIALERRRLLHAKVATALGAAAGDGEGTYAGNAALAYHWHEAGENAQAARASLAASEAAGLAYAPDEALEMARLAHQSALRVGEGAGEDALLPSTLLRLSDAEMARGQYIEAERTVASLLQLADRQQDSSLQGQAWLRLGLVARRREEVSKAAEAFATAIRTLERIPGQGTNVARALVELASIAGLTLAEYSTADEYAGRALELARSLGAAGLEAEALIALANSRTRSEGPHAARPMLVEALARAEAANELSLATDTAAGLSNNYYWSGELRQSEHFARKRLDLAVRAHDIFGLRHGHSWLALVMSSQGEWAEAQALLAEAEPMLARLASPEPVGFIRVISAFIHYRLGDNERACDLIGEALTRLEPLGDGTLLWYGSLAALIYLAANRPGEALLEVRRQENRLAALPPSALPARSARAALALVYVQLGDISAAIDCAANLREFVGDFHWSPVRLTLAKVDAARGDRDGAVLLLQEAELQARRELQRPDLAQILLARAELLADGSQRRAALSEASALVRDLRMSREVAVAERLSLSDRGPSLPHGLTPREGDVIRLVGRGYTNRQIAAELVISERTVVNHIANIFAKVGVENRAGLAAFAVRAGLTSGE
ncbi:hypothetical protein AYO38_01845 [bacterium SCGC AG-212-C10]|nr:hypothetical protein AYO38_01845 [bacterium SCGC AG-212-C10]